MLNIVMLDIGCVKSNTHEASVTINHPIGIGTYRAVVERWAGEQHIINMHDGAYIWVKRGGGAVG